jgi:hypothetical protein
MRSRYWSCSSFADWLRGLPKPISATSEEWTYWRQNAREQHPVRYWLAEEGLDALQNIIHCPADAVYSVKYYINNRWVTKTHALTAHSKDIKPGTWFDVGNRFLPCLFNELVDFVEIEQAWHHCIWDSEAQKKYAIPWWARGWFRWRSWRCPEAGIAHLNWAGSLVMDEEWGLDSSDTKYGKPTHQALAAQEILALYKWWTEVYPARPDPYEASGWTELCEERRTGVDDSTWFLALDKTPTQARKTKKVLDRCRKIEERYAREDEQMLIRLIKIRNHLWT